MPAQFVLKFTNPLYEEMSITLATPQIKKNKTEAGEQDEIKGKVTILSPHFIVGAYHETIEYDDEMYSVGGSSRRNNGSATGAASADGVYEKRNNYTSILVEVVPEQKGEFKVTLEINEKKMICTNTLNTVPSACNLQLQIR